MTRIIAILAFAVLVFFASAASADEVIVQQNNVALRAAPSKNGKVEWRVNEGYKLIVTSQQGSWLEVRAPNLIEPNSNLWVQAKYVAPIDEPADDVVSDADFRLELRGSLGVEFRSKCVFLEAGDDFRHVQWDHGTVPATVDIHGASVVCIVRGRTSGGRIDAALLNGEGVAIASAGTGGYSESLVIRSNGPWGSASGRSGGGRYVVMSEVPDLGVVPSFTNSPVPTLPPQ